MKNFKFKWLLLSIVLSIASINQMWAADGYKDIFVDATGVEAWYWNDGCLPYLEYSNTDAGSSYSSLQAPTEEYETHKYRYHIPSDARKFQIKRSNGTSSYGDYAFAWINAAADQACCSYLNNYYVITGQTSFSSKGTYDMPSGGHVYLYANNFISVTNLRYMYGRYDYTSQQEMTLIDNTEKLYYVSPNSFSSFSYWSFVSTGTIWTGTSWAVDNITGNATDYTAIKYGYKFNNGNTYYVEKTSASKGGSMSVEHKSSGYSEIPKYNSKVRVKVKESGAAGYSNGSTSDKPATTIRVRGTYLSGNGTSARSYETWTTGYETNDYGSVISGKVTPSFKSKSDDWQFDGWYIGGTQQSTKDSFDIYQPAEAKVIEARFTRIKYTVNFNQEGGSGGTSSIKATYGSAMPSITLPTSDRSGYTFDGYYSGEGGSGTKYYNADGSSARNSDLAAPSGTTLYAKWVQTVTLNDNNGGSNNGSTTATWKAEGPFVISAPTKTGYTVEGYYAEAGCTNKVLTAAGVIAGTNVSDGSSVVFISGSKWMHAAATTLYAKWTAKTTSVTLNPNTANHGTGESLVVTATYDQSALADFEAATPASGYTLDGYYTGATNGNKIVNADGTLVRNTAYTSDEATPVWKSEASSLTLYAHYTANPYTLTLDDQFGSTAFYVAANSGDATIDVTFDASTNLTSTISAPQREGYIFGGYYTSTGGSGTQIIDENGDVKASASDASYTYTDASRNWKYVGNLTVYAKWTDDDTYVYIGPVNPKGGFYDYGFWRNDNEWAKGKAPSDIDNHEVILIKQPSVENVSGETYTACAKNVKIITNGSYTCVDGTEIPIAEYPKLDIDDNGAIVVKEYVRTYDMEKGELGPTTSLNLHINAGTERWGAAGAGGVLIVGNKITDNKAWVEFYTKARKDGTYYDEESSTYKPNYVNQYFGIPFDSTSVHDYEGIYLYAYKAETNSYEAAGNKPVDPFKAYLMLRTQAEGTTLHMTGRLALPGTSLENKDRLKVLELYSKEDATASNMFANSWNGPLDIKAMDAEDDFVGVEPTFYLYNAGSKNDRDKADSWIGNGAGQWTSLPVSSLQADPKSYPQTVIPPQQAFLLVAQSDEEAGDTHTLTLDYYKHVYKPAYDSVKAGKKIEIAPTRAPKREKTDESLQIIRLIVVGQETSFNDRVIMYQRGDFSDGLDQGWEGRKIMGSAFAPQMFAISEDGKMSINAVKDVEGTVIGFRKGSEDAQYTISFEYEGDETWYLNDLKEEKSTLINDEETYAFTSDAGDIEARFVISATPIQKTPTSVDEVTEGIKVRKLMIDGTFYIIRDGRIYDIVGKSVK